MIQKYKDDAPRIEIVQRINSARKTKAGGEEENPDNNGNQERGRGSTWCVGGKKRRGPRGRVD